MIGNESDERDERDESEEWMMFLMGLGDFNFFWERVRWKRIR
jgi:hypothetical protein